MKSPFERKFIVNVSAMEGKFDYRQKTVRHPHTNMAKAALNMMTRTSSADYAEEGIYMNSVDTGWITEENPHPTKWRIIEDHRRIPPLDSIDGASRVYHPVVTGLRDKPSHGLFLKDYRSVTW